MNASLILSRMLGEPLLIEQGKADAILAVLAPRAGYDVLPSAEAMRQHEAAEAELRHEMVAGAARSIGLSAEQSDNGYARVGGVAVVPVLGTLVQRRLGMEAMSGMQSYATTSAMLAAAATDPSVHTVLLEVDSPGGEVSGVFALSEQIEAMRGKRRVVAYANERAASAAYLLAASASEVVANETSRLGSIGVVVTHVDRSKQLERQGLVVTHVYAGEKKVDGSPAAPLSDRARAELQGDVDSLYQMFTSRVDSLRGMRSGAAAATKAGILGGNAAVKAGLADRVESFSATLARLVRDSGREAAPTPRTETTRMSDPVESPQNPASAAPSPAATAPVPVNEQITAAATAKQHGVPEAVANERARMAAILESPEAAGRETLARHLAFKSDMTAEAAAAVLAAAPKEVAPATPAATASPLQAAMRAAGTPGIVGDVSEAASTNPAAADPWAAAVTKFGGK